MVMMIMMMMYIDSVPLYDFFGHRSFIVVRYTHDSFTVICHMTIIILRWVTVNVDVEETFSQFDDDNKDSS